MNPLLSVSDLGVTFTTPSGPLDAVRGVSFDLNRGETLAIVGESGSGKSVTALSVLQLLPYPAASHPSGSIRFEGRELVGAPVEAMKEIRGDRIAMIFQEPMTSLNPLHRVERQISETLMLHRGATSDGARARTLELLHLVGIKDPEDRLNSYPHELSGGQRQRVMIAMALANDPDILIADEPTTALDVTIQAQILTLLKKLQTELGMAMLLITHDLAVVRKVSDRVCVMTNGEIVEAGTVEEVFAAPAHSYTQHLLASEPKGDPPTRRVEACEVVKSQDLRVWFPIKRGILRRTVSHLKAVERVSLAVREGETVGVVGESGSGKTTLGLALLRLQSSTGSIQIHGREIQGLSWKQTRPLRREMQMVFQDPFSSLSPRMSIGSIIEEGLVIHKLGDAESRERKVRQALEEVGLDPESRHRYPHEFSGGQRQRVAIARAIILQPSFVILDEPTSALDRSVQAQIVDLLRDLQRRHGLSYLFISHDLRVVRALSHYVLVMRDGLVVEQGASDQIFHDPQEDYTRRLMRAAFDLEAA